MKNLVVFTLILAFTSGHVEAGEAVPNQILKRGLSEFIGAMTEPNESNICYNFFLALVENLVDKRLGIEAALEAAFQLDFTHMQPQDDSCRLATEAVTSKFSLSGSPETKFFAAWEGVEKFVKSVVKKNKFQKDNCLAFLLKLAKTVLEDETKGDVFKLESEKFAKPFFSAMFRTGLQVIENKPEHQELPCVKAANLVLSEYPEEMTMWLAKLMSFGNDRINDEL